MTDDIPEGLTPQLLDARTSTMDPPDAPTHPQDSFDANTALELATISAPIYDATKAGEQE